MTKIATFGSCLSNLTVAAGLERVFGCERAYVASFIRSDNFVRYFIEKSSLLPPIEFFQSRLRPRPEWEVAANELLENQYPPLMGWYELRHRRNAHSVGLLQALAEDTFDIIILDNYMDLIARLSVFSDDEQYGASPMFIVQHFYENDPEVWRSVKLGDLLTPEDSARSWAHIVRWLKVVQPNAKIVFMGFPYSADYGRKDRHFRSLALYEATQYALKDEGVLLIPPLDPPAKYRKGGDDWRHFTDPVYQALGHHIWLYLYAGLKALPPAARAALTGDPALNIAAAFD